MDSLKLHVAMPHMSHKPTPHRSAMTPASAVAAAASCVTYRGQRVTQNLSARYDSAWMLRALCSANSTNKQTNKHVVEQSIDFSKCYSV